jgi:biopolymer transport protein ExbB
MPILSWIATFLREGGPFMYPILIVAALTAAIAAERTIVILRSGMVDGGKLVGRVAKALESGQPQQARELVARGANPLIAVTRTLLERPVTGLGRRAAERELVETYEATASVSMAPLNHRLSYLATLANMATLLGLLGTILGLISAFRGVGVADPAQRSAFLAAGISQALNTTALGLMVAIPTLGLHTFLLAQVDGLADRLEATTQRIIQLIAGREPDAETGRKPKDPEFQVINKEMRSASVAVR